MPEPDSRLQLLLDLDARHDDLLRRLEELDRNLERALRESLALRAATSNEPRREAA